MDNSAPARLRRSWPFGSSLLSPLFVHVLRVLDNDYEVEQFGDAAFDILISVVGL